MRSAQVVLNRRRPVSASWRHARRFITTVIKVINGGLEMGSGAKRLVLGAAHAYVRLIIKKASMSGWETPHQ